MTPSELDERKLLADVDEAKRNLDERKRLADQISASLADTPPAAVRLLGRALMLAGGPLAEFGDAFDCVADALEFEDVTGELARLRLARALAVTARDSASCEELVERLDGADEPPWPAVREAVAGLERTDEGPRILSMRTGNAA
jgi:hypothetical protein